MNTDLTLYYKARAKEYEKIYDKPERQADLQRLTVFLQDIFQGKTVLEIACGTGYWTEKIAKTASFVLATDINDAVLVIARRKDIPKRNVNWEVADLFESHDFPKYDYLLGGFIWSHILLQELDLFLDRMLDAVSLAATLVFIDNIYIPDSNRPIVETDEMGNTFQERVLEDGSHYKVLKNFPTDTFLSDTLKSRGMAVEILRLEYYWVVVAKKRLNNDVLL